MEQHLGGTTIFKLHTTIAEGPQEGLRLTKMNMSVEPFMVVSFSTEQLVRNPAQSNKPLNVKLLQLTKIIIY